MKQVKKMWGWIIAFFLITLLTGCSKEKNDIPPLNPKLSPSSVSVEEGKSVEVTISGGLEPYVVSLPSAGIATARIEGKKLTLTGVKAGSLSATVEGSDGGSVSLPITVMEAPILLDPNAAFKANDTLRLEFNDGRVIKYGDPSFRVISDKGTLFSSDRTKFGFVSPDGSEFWIIGWNGTIDSPSSVVIWTKDGTVPVESFEIIKVSGSRIWMNVKSALFKRAVGNFEF